MVEYQVCPFCRTSMHKDAVVCPMCNAVKRTCSSGPNFGCLVGVLEFLMLAASFFGLMAIMLIFMEISSHGFGKGFREVLAIIILCLSTLLISYAIRKTLKKIEDSKRKVEVRWFR